MCMFYPFLVLPLIALYFNVVLLYDFIMVYHIMCWCTYHRYISMWYYIILYVIFSAAKCCFSFNFILWFLHDFVCIILHSHSFHSLSLFYYVDIYLVYVFVILFFLILCFYYHNSISLVVLAFISLATICDIYLMLALYNPSIS